MHLSLILQRVLTCHVLRTEDYTIFLEKTEYLSKTASQNFLFWASQKDFCLKHFFLGKWEHEETHYRLMSFVNTWKDMFNSVLV